LSKSPLFGRIFQNVKSLNASKKQLSKVPCQQSANLSESKKPCAGWLIADAEQYANPPMKNLILSAFVVFFPLAGTAFLFARTFRIELRNFGGKR
jgi:hypothetical protein